MAFDTHAAVKTLTDADADADADAGASEPFAVSRLARRRVTDGVAIAAVGAAVPSPMARYRRGYPEEVLSQWQANSASKT